MIPKKHVVRMKKHNVEMEKTNAHFIWLKNVLLSARSMSWQKCKEIKWLQWIEIEMKNI